MTRCDPVATRAVTPGLTAVDGPLAFEVVLLHWPRDRAKRDLLAATMRPRLLLVSDGHRPPATTDDLEDWVELPVEEGDVAARLHTLSSRTAAHLAAVVVVEGGFLRRGRARLTLSVSEAAFAAPLARTPGALVPRDELGEAVWPAGAPQPRSIDDLACRLRRRIRPLGLDLRSARGRGFALDILSPADLAKVE